MRTRAQRKQQLHVAQVVARRTLGDLLGRAAALRDRGAVVSVLVDLTEEVAVLDINAVLEQFEAVHVDLDAVGRDLLGVGDGGLALAREPLDLRRDLEALLGVAEEVPLEVRHLLLVALDLAVWPPADAKAPAAFLEDRNADPQLGGCFSYGNVEVHADLFL